MSFDVDVQSSRNRFSTEKNDLKLTIMGQLSNSSPAIFHQLHICHRSFEKTKCILSLESKRSGNDMFC